MSRFETQESLVTGFLSVLVLAGMQHSAGTHATKPKFFRGYVPPKYSTATLFMRYNVDDNGTVYSADNDDFMRSIEIGGEIYTRNGYGDATYQKLCKDIETYCKQSDYIIEWQNETTDASFDADSPVPIKRFAVTKNKI